MLHLLLAFCPADPVPLPTTIREVTLYGDTALVRRSGAPAGSGEYMIRGLPASLDPANVRVRCEGGDVVDVETRERLQQTLPSERLQALREKLKLIAREQQLALDEGELLKQQAQHLERMRAAEATARAPETGSARPSVEAWSANFDFLARKVSEVSRAQRANVWKLEDIAERLATAQKELGTAQSGGAVQVYDVRVRIEARGQVALDLEYLVSNTGWRPAYDLRAQKTLAEVELVYRAQVWQHTGEDWSEVALALSSARPQIGAQGPEPVATWVGVEAPQTLRALGYAEGEKSAGRRKARLEEAEDRAAAPAAPRPFAAVQSEGLSVRFQLPKPATIQSRAEPTTLLVGNATLAIRAERHCVPALDTTVWLRAKATNTSPWAMLPGTAAVFFGADYLGPAEIGAVQPGQELVLHLGADPGLSVKREQIEDQNKGPGFLSSTSSDVKSWRLHFENHGTLGASADGSVEVIVREVLPRPRDERIEVEVSKSSPAESGDKRFEQDRKERGIHTWILKIPTGEKGLDLVWQRTISFPEGAQISIQ